MDLKKICMIICEIWTFPHTGNHGSYFTASFTKHSGNFLLLLGLESAFENAPFGGSSEGLHDHYPSIPKYPAGW